MNRYDKGYFVFTALIFALIFKSGLCYSQQSIDLTQIDLIIYNKYDTEIRLFQKESENSFIEVYLYFEDNYHNNFVSITIDYDVNEIVTLKDIHLGEDDVLLHVKDLKKTTSFAPFLKKGFEVNEDSFYKEGKDTNKLVLKFLNTSLATIQEVNFQKKRQGGGFGSRVHRSDDNEERWRIYYAHFFSVVDLNFGNDKHIYLLLNEDAIDFLFLPLVNTDYLISDDDGISSVTYTSKYTMNYWEDFKYFEFDSFVSIFKNKEEKYELLNSFKTNLLGKQYDTIRHNNLFIIGENKGQIDVFNSYYEKIKIDNIKSAYLYRSGLEILNDIGANYYNSETKIIKKFPQMSYTLCGSVSRTSFNLDYDKHSKTNTLIKVDGGYLSGIDERRTYVLESIKKEDSVTFLNNKKAYYWGGNDDYVGKNYGYPQLLKIVRGKKSGIFEYNYDNTSIPIDTISKVFGKEIIYSPQKTQSVIALPIKNDSIVFHKKDGLIYFYRKGKVGIFPRDKDVQYNYIKQITNSFYTVYRGQKKGWLDIKSNLEYYDE